MNINIFVAFWAMHAHFHFCGVAQSSLPSIPSQTNTRGHVCWTKVGNDENDAIINLEPLARKDGFPRFVATYQFGNHLWNYSFNPCEDYNVPNDNPHTGFGDGCHSVSVCKYTLEHNRRYYFTLGIQASAKFHVRTNNKNNQTVELVYNAIKSMRTRQTVIKLVCDQNRTEADDGLFKITNDSGRGPLDAELHHQCCCPDGCVKPDIVASAENNTNSNMTAAESREASISKKGKKNDGGMLLFVIGTLVALVMLVALIGGLCYVKHTQLQIYSKIPTAANSPSQGIGLAGKKDFRDYEPAGLARKKLLPVLEDTMIHLEALDMCQRLGGGIFGDTHLAKWHEMNVAVKRLTLLVHENQITPEAMKLMKNEVWFLSRQRHKNIVTILGLCLDGKLPSMITEYVVGECLKEFIKSQGHLLSWPHRIRICSQVADGMAFLHSTKPPIIHRDLRCGNLFLLDNDVIKVADFGLIKMLQPIREECPNDDCCCRRTQSACPPSIRWTAPELLAHPVAKERLVPPAQENMEAGSKRSASAGDIKEEECIITPACDVYSFAMVMWELPMCQDPFEEIANEAEVLKIVKNGGRPETPPFADIMPHYKELMKYCWDQMPSNRPTFKQIASRLKDLGSQARSYQKQVQNNQRLQKLQKESAPV